MKAKYDPKAFVTNEALDHTIDRLIEVIDEKLDRKFTDFGEKLTKRMDKGFYELDQKITVVKDDLKGLAYNAPTKQEFDSLKKRVDRLERTALRN